MAGNNGRISIRDTSLVAYNYPKRSGAIKAKYARNVFTVQTSCVRSFSLFLSPSMVDFSKPITVRVNGKLYYKRKIKYNKVFMVQSFHNSFDRSAVWVNHIDIDIAKRQQRAEASK